MALYKSFGGEIGFYEKIIIHCLAVGAVPVTYDFSNAGSKAFGANQVQLENGLWALYSGDTNLDGNVDNSDYGLWEGDANSFANGDYSTAPNGNGNLDNSDYGIW